MAPIQQPELNTLRVSSPAFGPEGAIPRRHTCQGDDVSFPVRVENVPDAAKTLALILDDPDAPGGTFTHWTVWNLPAAIAEIGGGHDVTRAGGREGRNDFGRSGYGGPCPPSGTHRYVTRVYALDAVLRLSVGAPRGALEDAMGGHVRAWGELVGTYRKS